MAYVQDYRVEEIMNEVPCPLQAMASHIPAAAALIDPQGVFSWRDLHACVSAMAALLDGAGLRKGDIAAIALPPGPACPMVVMAMIRKGVIAFPIDPRFPEAYRSEILDRVHAAAIIVSKDASPGEGLVSIPLDRLMVKRPPLPPDEEIWLSLDAPATLVLTSGSSGAPKAALHSFGNHYHSALRSNANIALGPEDRWLMSLPMYHVAGLGVWFRCLLGGAAVLFPGLGQSLDEALREYPPTHLSLVATQLYRLLRDPEILPLLRGMKAILLGGSGIPAALLHEAHAADLPIFTSYGLTEMATQVTTTAPGDPLDRLLTSGRPLSPDSLRISPEAEIQVRGETLFLGYIEGDTLLRPLQEDGWFATGDCGFIDEAGYLQVTGRRDNMFIAGGENIQPEEIEAALCRIDGVLEAVVTPVPHAEFGNTPAAFLRLAEGVALDGAFLSAQLAGCLPKFKVPRYYFAWPEIAIPDGGKIPRRAFCEEARRRIAPETGHRH
jgi:o-succinylbenzoate---CoA ligase